MRSVRQHRVDLAIASALQLAAPHIMPESLLKVEAGRLAVPRPTESELDAAIRYHDSSKRLTSVMGETETMWKLNAAGLAWLTENE